MTTEKTTHPSPLALYPTPTSPVPTRLHYHQHTTTAPSGVQHTTYAWTPHAQRLATALRIPLPALPGAKTILLPAPASDADADADAPPLPPGVTHERVERESNVVVGRVGLKECVQRTTVGRLVLVRTGWTPEARARAAAVGLQLRADRGWVEEGGGKEGEGEEGVEVRVEREEGKVDRMVEGKEKSKGLGNARLLVWEGLLVALLVALMLGFGGGGGVGVAGSASTSGSGSGY